MVTFYDLKAAMPQGKSFDFAQLKDKVVLIVNTASKCGFTPQYAGLEEIYKKYHSRGFEILGFPCNQFGSQEPGNNDEIQEFCQLNFGVTFPIMAKIDVNGKNADPVYQWLKGEAPGVLGTEFIKKIHTVFMSNKDISSVKRFSDAFHTACRFIFFNTFINTDNIFLLGFQIIQLGICMEF